MSLLQGRDVHPAWLHMMDYSDAARWIWTPDEGAQRNLWLRLRRAFDCPGDLKRATLLISADSRYELYVNGEWLGVGPVRSFPWAYGYDRYDVTSWLRPGAANVVAARVVQWGDHTFQYIVGRGGLLCELMLERADGDALRVTSNGAWLCSPDAAVERNTPRIAVQQGFEEHYDARRADDDWTHPGYAPNGWEQARDIGPVGMEPWTTLEPRTIPFLTRDEVTPVRVLAAEVARPRAGYRWAFDLRERLGKGRIGLRAELIGQRAQAFATEIVVSRPCMVGLTLASEYAAFRVSCNGQEALSSTMFHRAAPSLPLTLKEGHNLFVLAGTDLPSMQFETEETLTFDATRLLPDAGGNRAWAYLGPLDERDDTLDRVMAATDPYALPPVPCQAVSAADRQDDVQLLTSTQRFLLPANGFCDVSISLPQPRERLDDDGAPLVDDVNALLHRTADAAILYPHPAGDTHLVVDFGREIVGYLVLELDAPEGTVVDANLFEGIDDSGIFWTDLLRNTVRYTCRGGRQTFRSHQRRGFRYASLTVRVPRNALAPAAPVQLYNLRCILSTYPVAEQGRFACSDALLTKIWEVAAYTVRLCMEDTYVDCPAYEQVFWVGDARNSALVNAVAFGAFDLTERCLRLTGQSLSRDLDRVKPPHLRERTHLTTDHVVSGWFSEIPMWTFLWIWNVWEHYELTGDRVALAAHYADVRECLRRCLGFLSERGLLDVPDVWNLVDWAAMDLTRDGEVTSSNALLVESLRRAARMAEVVADAPDGRAADGTLRDAAPGEAAGYRDAAARIEAAINTYCWSDQHGAYVDTVRDEPAYARYAARMAERGAPAEPRDHFLARTRVSEPTNTLVLQCDCAPPERAARILPLVQAARKGTFIGSDPSRAPAWPADQPVPVGSPWFLFFTLETLLKHGELDAVLDIVREQWGRMLAKGATTFWETFPGYNAGHWSRSLCHGWSAAPAYFLSTQILGVEPAAPGYASVRVTPRAAGLTWADGAVPTPHGPVRVNWSRDARQWDIAVDLPAGITGNLIISEQTAEPRADGEVGAAAGVVERDGAGWRIALTAGRTRCSVPLVAS